MMKMLDSEIVHLLQKSYYDQQMTIKFVSKWIKLLGKLVAWYLGVGQAIESEPRRVRSLVWRGALWRLVESRASESLVAS